MADETLDPQQEPNAEELQTGGDAPQEETLPEVGVDVEDVGNLKKKVTVTVPQERVEAKRDEMFGELTDTAQIPGFRIGHAPRRLVEKRFGREVDSDVRNALIGEGLREAMDKTEFQTIGEPDLDLDEIELPESGPLEFSFEVEVVPEFELPEIKGIEVKKPSTEVTEDRIDEQVEQIRTSRATFQPTDEPAREDDVVTADVEVTGEGIDPVQREGQTLRVAPGQVEGVPLTDLGEKLTGAKAGETVTLTTTVPTAHPNEDWHEKELTFEITIREVRRRELPAADDALAESMGFESMEELREYARERMGQRTEVEAEQDVRRQVEDYLLENTDLDVPEGAAERHTQSVLQRQVIQMMRMGMPRETIDEHITEMQTQAAEQARRELKLRFILGKVIEQEDIDVTEGEINARIAQMAAMYGRRPERLRQELASDGSLEQLVESMREDKAIDHLMSQAEVSEAPDEDEATGGEDAEASEDDSE